MARGIVIQSPESGFTDIRMFHSHEIVPLMEQAGFVFERLVGCEGPMNLRLYDTMNQMPEDSKNQIFNSIIKYSEWPTLLDSSDHLLFVGRKPGLNEEALLSESALSDWNRPEEDRAWAYLQHDRS